MPQHITNDYFKLNSHLSSVEDIENQNHQVAKEEYDYFPFSKYFNIRVIPLIVIHYSDEYLFLSDHLNTCPRNSFPKYILAMVQYLDLDIYKFALVKLGKLGIDLNDSNCKVLQLEEELNDGQVKWIEYLRSEEDVEPVVSFQNICRDEINICLSVFTDLFNLRIKLCQKNIENTKVKIKKVGDSMIMPFTSHSLLKSLFESTNVSPQIRRNGKSEHILCYGINNYTNVTYTISQFTYENNIQEIKDTFMFESSIGNSFLLVNQKSNEIYLMIYGFNNEFYKITPRDNNILEYKIEEITFQNYSSFKPTNHSSRNNILSCPLTASKYLVLIYENDDKQLEKSYQWSFTNEFKWLLVDLETHSVKRVYPRVYPLKDQIESSNDDFIRVKKSKKGRGQFLFPDGDLNGGYSDPSLLKSISKNPSSIIGDFQSSLIPIEKDKIWRYYSRLFAFRPFAENPELFQVHLSVYDRFMKKDRKKNKHTYGKFFRFYFKFRDEATCKYSQLFESARDGKFSDISINLF